MQRGAYEALSLTQPIITSDWPVLRRSFADAAIYVQNDAAAIAEGVERLLANQARYKQAAATQKRKRAEYYRGMREEILARIQGSSA
jgi:spore maturation protein CgeB